MLVEQGGRFQSVRTSDEYAELFLKEIESLPPEERQFALEVLNDYLSNNSSPALEISAQSIYKTIPCKMEEFLNNPFYLGSFAKTIFPTIKSDLTEIFEGGYSQAIFGGALGGGKKLPLSSNVLTPTGFRQIKDLAVGDRVCNPDGSVSVITHLHEITLETEYIFEMSDGQTIASCKDHLWYGGWRRDKSDPCKSWDNPNCIKTTKQVFDQTQKQRSLNSSKKLFKIPITEPVEFDDIGGRTIDPYLLGYMLGNGEISSRRVKITVSAADYEFYKSIADGLGSHYDTDFRKYGKNCFDIAFSGQTRLSLVEDLKKLSLFDRDTRTKFVPDCYKYAPKDVRLSILRGLLDSDGSVDKASGKVNFYSTNKRLAEDVQWLARSIGCFSTIRKRKGRDRESADGTKVYQCSDSYEVYIRSRDSSLLFMLDRKKKKCLKPTNQLYNTVLNVRLGDAVPMRCITVSHPNGLYLTDDFTVTHNTTAGVIGIMRMIYEVSCLRSPHEIYKISSSDYISFPCVSTTESVAERNIIDKIRAIVSDSEYFQTLYKPEKMSMSQGIVFPNRIIIPPGASTSQQIVGSNAMGCFIDESNFFQNRQASIDRAGDSKEGIEIIYEAIKRRMESRFLSQGKLPGVILICSSKTNPNSFTERLIHKHKEDPRAYVRERAVWESVPKGRFSGKIFKVAVGDETRMSKILVDGESDPEGMNIIEVPVEFKQAFEDDIDMSIRDYAGRSTVSIAPFIAKREKIYECIDKTRSHPFNQEVWEQHLPGVINWSKICKLKPDGTYEPLHHPGAPRHIHLDLSKNQDRTGITVSCVGGYAPVNRFGKSDTEMAPIIHVDFMIAIQAPRGGEILYSEIRKMIYEFSQHGFFIKLVTADQFQSLSLLQAMRQQGYKTDIVSVEPAGGPYELLKQALYENRISMYHYAPVIKELRELQKNSRTGKVDHPEASQGGRKDISDALAACVATLTKSAYGISDQPLVNRSADALTENEDQWILGEMLAVSGEQEAGGADWRQNADAGQNVNNKPEWRQNAEKALEQEGSSNYDWKSSFTMPFITG